MGILPRTWATVTVKRRWRSEFASIYSIRGGDRCRRLAAART